MPILKPPLKSNPAAGRRWFAGVGIAIALAISCPGFLKAAGIERVAVSDQSITVTPTPAPPGNFKVVALEPYDTIIRRLRIDPIESSQGTFEIDYFTTGRPNDLATDADGAPDADERLWNRNPYLAENPAANADGDTYSDIEEMIMGSDPDDRASFISVKLDADPNTAGMAATACSTGSGSGYRQPPPLPADPSIFSHKFTGSLSTHPGVALRCDTTPRLELASFFCRAISSP